MTTHYLKLPGCDDLAAGQHNINVIAEAYAVALHRTYDYRYDRARETATALLADMRASLYMVGPDESWQTHVEEFGESIRLSASNVREIKLAAYDVRLAFNGHGISVQFCDTLKTLMIAMPDYGDCDDRHGMALGWGLAARGLSGEILAAADHCAYEGWLLRGDGCWHRHTGVMDELTCI